MSELYYHKTNVENIYQLTLTFFSRLTSYGRLNSLERTGRCSSESYQLCATFTKSGLLGQARGLHLIGFIWTSR